MVIIGFSTTTSLLIPNILCSHFKHCAVITQKHNKMFLYQFVRYKHTDIIEINDSGINKLAKYGWVFIYIPKNISSDFNLRNAITCVDMVKRAIGLKRLSIQTPDKLYHYLIGI
ncbi:MAG: hypothetical protein KBS86_00665 [Proteobacteria bacterium]|nr:hypothetical protein [Candidatus Enterousia scatequi]